MTGSQRNWERFAGGVGTQDTAAGKSSMWQGLVADFDVRQWPADPHTALFRPGAFRGYGFFSQNLETPLLRARGRLLELTDWVARLATFTRNRVWQWNVGGLGVEHLAFHPAGLRSLRQFGLHHRYQAFCSRFGLSLHSAAGIKACYVASLLEGALSAQQQPRAFEVGGGFGNVAAQLHARIPLYQYVVVDLPEMLLHSSLSLATLFPDVPAYFLYPGSSDRYDPDLAGFYYCTPEAAQALPDATFHAGWNVDSFQEMTRVQVAGYLDLMQRVLAGGAHLLTLNRRKQLDAEGFDNNPLMYPFAPENRVIRWETDAFMDRTFNYDRVRLDGWVLRLEQISERGESEG